MTTRDEIFSGTKEVDEKLVFNSDNLNDYLKKIIGSEFDIVSIKQFKGGQSNPTYLIEDKTKNYVLRRKPPGKLLKSAHAVDREYIIVFVKMKTSLEHNFF